ncbi:MAG TPA: DUF883 C-terminal domain-containing protein [Blastocatellia bacterium]|nr:DUF883 C-terminal domain-containing protein [Blastocatellia bacterium]
MGYERSNKQDIGRGRGNSAFDQIKSTVADKLHAAAQTIHQKTAGSARPSEFSDFGHRAADWLERSADYVSDLEPQRLKTDLENQVRRNPGRSLLIAGAVGLVLGRVIRRR